MFASDCGEKAALSIWLSCRWLGHEHRKVRFGGEVWLARVSWTRLCGFLRVRDLA
jgi:hypothetical protein